ncbi:MAG: hypothetical protein P8K68_09610 [Algibacter sp.]|uniref:hypothetical protein n=1 Tax=Algibacter sp. TaxID=1872428 RepID=UPI0026289932|nr:hypothetical protein [Algibacter sp.]MDG1729307.1 hypothetical protein [Algibacter sp.]MDG2179026.1 hypothetical protein [Algibacter sp.]
MRNNSLLIKLDLTRGGAISFISKTDEKRNLVNIHDEGRYIQQSYYAGKRLDRQDEGQSPRWSPWTWNPIQVGDAYFNRAQILASEIKGNTVYTQCIPMLWDMNNKPAEAIMEQWTTLEDNVIKVKNKLTCQRTDTLYGEGMKRSQELPAVYPISSLSELYSYVGEKPFTKGPMKKLEVKFLQNGFWGRYQNGEITESWMAFVDQNNWGMAVYSPSTQSFLAGMSGRPGGEAESGSTSYIAPVKKVALYKNSVFEYEYYIIIGQLEEMRETIYDIQSKN